MIGRVLPFAAGRAPGARDPSQRAPGPGARAEAAAGGADAEAFRRTVLPYLDQAYAYARYLARDDTVAEDLTQEAFLKAFRGFAGFRGGDARAWLLAIVRNGFLSWSRARPPWSDAGEAALEQAACGDEDAEAQLVRRGEAAGLRAAIEALPEPFREALVLRELEELSYRQISELTGAPIGTVMSRLARARRMLAELLLPEEAPR